jgi:hypothetical protein
MRYGDGTPGVPRAAHRGSHVRFAKDSEYLAFSQLLLKQVH